MKINEMHWFNIEDSSETLAFFGKARLIRLPDGRHDLVGGSAHDRSTARKWCSLFAPEVDLKVEARHAIDFAD
jgi:hypothetical protein